MKNAVIVGLVFSVIVGIGLYLPIGWKGWVLIAVATLPALYFAFNNPTYWYRRTASLLLASWLAMAAAPSLKAFVDVDSTASGYFELIGSPGIVLHVVLGVVFTLLLVCDVLTLHPDLRPWRARRLRKEAADTLSSKRSVSDIRAAVERMPESESKQALLFMLQSQAGAIPLDLSNLTQAQRHDLISRQLGYAFRHQRMVAFRSALYWLLAAVVLVGIAVAAPSIIQPFPALQVYLEPESGEVPKEFSLVYRTESGQHSLDGRNGFVVVQDVHRRAKELVVSDVHCFGMQSKYEADGVKPPWKYPIVDRTVSIPLVPDPPAEDEYPTGPLCLELLDKYHEVSADQLAQKGRYPKGEITLQVMNKTHVKMDVVYFDLSTCKYGDGPVLNETTGEAFSKFLDVRGLEFEDVKTSSTVDFNNFYEPTGWFMFFVRYEDILSNSVKQEYAGVLQLFDSQRPFVDVEPAVGNRSYMVKLRGAQKSATGGK